MPQLNFRVPQSLLDRIDAAKPDFLDRKGFLCLLLDEALDKRGTLGGPSAAGTPSTSKAVTTRQKRVSIPYIDIGGLIDPELFCFRDQLIEWWQMRRTIHGKSAIGTEQAWKASQNALKAILRVHGQKVAQDTLAEALAAGWRGIRESYAVVPKQNRGSAPPEPTRHPAGRLFQNGRFVDEDGPVTNPALEGLF